SQGLKVAIANVLMTANLFDNAGVIALAKELGVSYTLDPTITPRIDGDTSILALRAPGSELRQVFRNPDLVGNVEEFCAPPPAPAARGWPTWRAICVGRPLPTARSPSTGPASRLRTCCERGELAPHSR